MSWPSLTTGGYWSALSFVNAFIAAINERITAKLLDGTAYTPFAEGDDVQLASLWAQLQDNATDFLDRFPYDFDPSGLASLPSNPGRTIGEVLPHDFYERRRPREVTTFSSTTDTQGNALAEGMVAWVLEDDPGAAGCYASYDLDISDGMTFNPIYRVTETAAGSKVWTGDGWTIAVASGVWEMRNSDSTVRFTAPLSDCPPTNKANWTLQTGGPWSLVAIDPVGSTGEGTPARARDPYPLYTRQSDGSWLHTPTASPDTLSNYAAAPDAVRFESGGAMRDYGPAGGAHYDEGYMQAGDYIGQWIFEQLKLMLQAAGDQCLRESPVSLQQATVGTGTGAENKTTMPAPYSSPSLVGTLADAKAIAEAELPASWSVVSNNSTPLSATSRVQVQEGWYLAWAGDNQYHRYDAYQVSCSRSTILASADNPYNLPATADGYTRPEAPTTPTSTNVVFDTFGEVGGGNGIFGQDSTGIGFDALETQPFRFGPDTSTAPPWPATPNPPDPPAPPPSTTTQESTLTGYVVPRVACIVIYRPDTSGLTYQ